MHLHFIGPLMKFELWLTLLFSLYSVKREILDTTCWTGCPGIINERGIFIQG